MFSSINYNKSSALQMRGQVLPQCSQTIFLGLVFDDKMPFSAHTTTICTKIYRYIGFMNKLSHFIPKKPLTCLYHSPI